MEGSHMEAYCVKCREKREIEGAEEVTFKNGRKAKRGTCGHCGTSVYRFAGIDLDVPCVAGRGMAGSVVNDVSHPWQLRARTR